MKKIKLKHIFLLPIMLTMIVSISHVIVWYSLSNEYLWSIFMSISVEIGAMVALVAATKKIKGNIWGMFFIVTFIQMIGNIFYSYKQIDANGELFKSWMELTGPVWEVLGSKANDVIAMKRWLAFLEGGLLPIISLTSLHFFTKYDDGKTDKEEVKEIIKEVIVEKEVIKEVSAEVEKIVEVPVIEYIEVEKIVEIEKIVEVPVIQYVEVEKPVYIKENLFDRNTGEIDLSQDKLPISNEIFFPSPINDEYVSPEMDTHEPPRSNRLSYVKP